MSYCTDTLGDILDRAATEAGHKIAIVSCAENIKKNYKELREDAESFAAGLLDLGLKRGDLIGVWSPNNYAWVVAHFALAKAGMIMVAINTSYRVTELLAVLQTTELQAIIIGESLNDQHFHKILCSALPGLEGSRSTTLALKTYPSLKHVISMGDPKIPGTLQFWELSKCSNKYCGSFSNVQCDDPLYILFTSGTSGSAKGVVLTHFNVVNSVKYMSEKTVDSMEFSNCNPLPLFNTFGCIDGLVMPLSALGKVVIPSVSFSSEAVVKAIQDEKCNYMMGSPAMFWDILNLSNLKQYDISSLKRVMIGGSACYQEIMRWLKLELKVTILVNYGLTETSSFLSAFDIKHRQRNEDFQGSSGSPLAMTELKIVDKNGLIVDVGTRGQILARGPTLYQGYWKCEQKTKESMAPGKWFRTGDLGRLDSKGYLYVEGRLKELVIRGGENIHPREVEELLLTHPHVSEASVVGVSDKRMTEELCVWIITTANVNLREEELKSFMQGKISEDKIPKYFVFREKFPRTSVGKVQKFLLKEEAEKMFGEIERVIVEKNV